MKTFKNLLFAVFTAVISVIGLSDVNAAEAARKVNADSPNNTVKKFAAAMCELKFDEAKKYCDKDMQKIVDSAAAILKAMPADTPKEDLAEMKKTLKESFSFTVKGEKINGDKAVVTFSSRNNGKTEESTLSLKRINGKWIICE